MHMQYQDKNSRLHALVSRAYFNLANIKSVINRMVGEIKSENIAMTSIILN
jgi:hypothetical protein